MVFFFSTYVFSETPLENCSVIKNVAKKLECKLKNVTSVVTSKIDGATEGITSKKTLADFFKKK